MPVLQTVKLKVGFTGPAWIDTGMNLNPSDSLRIVSSGVLIEQDSDPDYIYPEGYYVNGEPTNTYDPAAVKNYGEFSSNDWFVSNTRPYALSLITRAQGVVPVADDDNPIGDAVRVNRDATITGISGRVWLIVNLYENFESEVTGEYEVTLERSGTAVIDVGSSSPIRGVHPTILAKKKNSVQRWAWILAVKPRYGDWEGYTAWDQVIDCPEYVDGRGNVTPAISYQPNGARMTNLPVEIKLGVKASDITLYAPRITGLELEDTPEFWIDRVRLENGYYNDAFWELSEVDPEDTEHRLLWQCGTLGNTQLDDLTATIQLTGYDELANRNVGDVYHLICQVGQIRGEKWGTGRCLNVVLQDGPDRFDHMVKATIMEPLGYSVLRLSFGTVAQSGAPLPAYFAERLANGDAEFLIEGESGANFAAEVGIKSGELISPGVVEVKLRRSLGILPTVGDKLWLVAGCKRQKTDCIMWNNLPNMRAQDLPGQDDLIRRTRT